MLDSIAIRELTFFLLSISSVQVDDKVADLACNGYRTLGGRSSGCLNFTYYLLDTLSSTASRSWRLGALVLVLGTRSVVLIIFLWPVCTSAIAELITPSRKLVAWRMSVTESHGVSAWVVSKLIAFRQCLIY